MRDLKYLKRKAKLFFHCKLKGKKIKTYKKKDQKVHICILDED